MKVKTSELSGVQLDYAVACSVDWGQPVLHITSGGSFVELMGVVFSPTSNWSQCGPMIAEFGVWLSDDEGAFTASCKPHFDRAIYDAETPQIAICRAVVAAKLGDEVDIPDELMESKL